MAIIGDEALAGYTTVDGTASFNETTGENSFTVGAGTHKYALKAESNDWFKSRLNELAILTLQKDFIRTAEGHKR